MTTDAFRRNSDNFCYRHPDRVSFVLCQRCLRTICAECQTQGAVGVICPECMRDQQKAQTDAQRKAEKRWASRPRAVTVSDSRPYATYGIILATAVVFVLQLVIPGHLVERFLGFAGAYVDPTSGYALQPWRLLTVAFVHDGFWHIALNMLALYMIGRSLEPLLGHWRFVVLYFLSALGGSVAVALLMPPTVLVVGASGAIFGLFGALLVIGRHIGADIRTIAILIAINFFWPFIIALISSIGRGSFSDALATIAVSWQAHLGGLLTGGLVGLIYARTRTAARRAAQIWLLVGTAVALLALLVIPVLFYR
ncbi:rhomboid family intramembrane serine protease [Microbacterium sp. B2969]|uniref:Rhomboid family intramembrane serine protease n=1 Tax=Microbacterium alkaliflavum TaxID=3248839 RepID=A0ABW7QA87_9MICO